MNNKAHYKSFPYDIQELDSKLNKDVSNKFKAQDKGYVQVGPEKWLLPYKYKEQAKIIYNFKVRPDDVWIVTFPRSGTTVTQEMIWLIANDLDFTRAREVNLTERFPFLDSDFLITTNIENKLIETNSHSETLLARVRESIHASKLLNLQNQTSRRFIKTHLSFNLLPPDLFKVGCKVIYVARNPKDVIVSCYHFSRLSNLIDFQGTFEEYWKYFNNDLVEYSPYWYHVKEGWQKRKEENVLFLYYEDIIKDMKGTIIKVSEYLKKPLTLEQIKQLESHLTFENFKKNERVNYESMKKIGVSKTDGSFIRCGKINGWQEYFSKKMNEEANQWIEDNLRSTGLKFPI